MTPGGKFGWRLSCGEVHDDIGITSAMPDNFRVSLVIDHLVNSFGFLNFLSIHTPSSSAGWLSYLTQSKFIWLFVFEARGKQVSRVLTLTSGPTEPEPLGPRSQDWTGTGTWHYHCHWCIIMSSLQYHHCTVFTTIFIKGIINHLLIT